ncbi:hypothetical protein JMN32_20760 [Fulvivirga sp. 29W222]|uniref:Uncharacterized protein n=1 Tax=Fulvivirga marina TaxID=2494733 RepID=A0A937KD37_9BACT|nr:hypothetical protein [Fulvivirga marina]MBL6448756.1 hypothetical protein [Fulvivirga marina]
MRRVVESVKSVFLLMEQGVLIIISLPLMFIVQLFIWTRNELSEGKYAKFLRQLDGKYISCYSNNYLGFIEQELLSKLPNSVEAIFTHGSILKSNYNRTDPLLFLGPYFIYGHWKRKNSDQIEVMTKDQRKRKNGSFYESGIAIDT